jgi:hypothetical protein
MVDQEDIRTGHDITLVLAARLLQNHDGGHVDISRKGIKSRAHKIGAMKALQQIPPDLILDAVERVTHLATMLSFSESRSSSSYTSKEPVVERVSEKEPCGPINRRFGVFGELAIELLLEYHRDKDEFSINGDKFVEMNSGIAKLLGVTSNQMQRAIDPIYVEAFLRWLRKKEAEIEGRKVGASHREIDPETAGNENHSEEPVRQAAE